MAEGVVLRRRAAGAKSGATAERRHPGSSLEAALSAGSGKSSLQAAGTGDGGRLDGSLDGRPGGRQGFAPAAKNEDAGLSEEAAPRPTTAAPSPLKSLEISAEAKDSAEAKTSVNANASAGEKRFGGKVSGTFPRLISSPVLSRCAWSVGESFVFYLFYVTFGQVAAAHLVAPALRAAGLPDPPRLLVSVLASVLSQSLWAAVLASPGAADTHADVVWLQWRLEPRRRRAELAARQGSVFAGAAAAGAALRRVTSARAAGGPFLRPLAAAARIYARVPYAAGGRLCAAGDCAVLFLSEAVAAYAAALAAACVALQPPGPGRNAAAFLKRVVAAAAVALGAEAAGTRPLLQPAFGAMVAAYSGDLRAAAALVPAQLAALALVTAQFVP